MNFFRIIEREISRILFAASFCLSRSLGPTKEEREEAEKTPEKTVEHAG